VAGVAQSAAQASKKATGNKQAPTVDSRAKSEHNFAPLLPFGTTLGINFYHLGTVFTICGPRLMEETCQLGDDLRKQVVP
jgi:hypothetical protein